MGSSLCIGHPVALTSRERRRRDGGHVEDLSVLLAFGLRSMLVVLLQSPLSSIACDVDRIY